MLAWFRLNVDQANTQPYIIFWTSDNIVSSNRRLVQLYTNTKSTAFVGRPVRGTLLLRTIRLATGCVGLRRLAGEPVSGRGPTKTYDGITT